MIISDGCTINFINDAFVQLGFYLNNATDKSPTALRNDVDMFKVNSKLIYFGHRNSNYKIIKSGKFNSHSKIL
jgi:hypothetical protein